ncbi:hypothetical protein G6F40_014876 [Rhizopus arrhizus]|nr:hypothetical protein G6F40_014876 [Rhizopus arrhizus]
MATRPSRLHASGFRTPPSSSSPARLPKIWQCWGLPAAHQEARERTQLADAQAALNDSQAQLQQVTDAVPALIAQLDKEHRYRFANKAFLDWHGISLTELLGRAAGRAQQLPGGAGAPQWRVTLRADGLRARTRRRWRGSGLHLPGQRRLRVEAGRTSAARGQPAS